jgi:hypothetical protein
MISAAVVASILSGSFVQARADTTTISDPQDAGGKTDIESVEAGRAHDGRIRYRITTFAPFARSESPCLAIQAGLHRDGYSICGTGDVTRVSDDARTGRAKVTRPSGRSVVYTFGSAAIGSPSFYRWRVMVLDASCTGGVCDKSPDSGYITHQRRMTYGGWSKRFLHELHTPKCTQNRIAVVAWVANEGTAAVWNPLATTYALAGATNYNGVGVKNYPSLGQGLDATRLTIERGFTAYGYGEIVRRLDRCAPPMKTARAIKRSSWCGGCSGGRYVTGLIGAVKSDYPAYGGRSVATAL